MKIIKTEHVGYIAVHVENDEGGIDIYRRYNKDDWHYKTVDGFWMVGYDHSKLEKLYQEGI